jgi:hypothetical protein
MTTERMQPPHNPPKQHDLKHRRVLSVHQWRNATSSSRREMEKRQVKMNRVVKRLCHTLLLSHARRDKRRLIEMAE